MAYRKPHSGKFINCLNCSTSFYIPKNRFDTAKYCSRKCLALGTMTQETKNCQICGVTFSHIGCRATSAKYCSRPCYYRGQLKKGTVKQKCIACGEEYATSPSKSIKRRHCSVACINRGILGEWKPGFMHVRKYMKARGLITACSKCGFDKHPEILGVHHIDRDRKNNSLDNLAVLCANCHSIEHMYHVPHGFKE